MAVKQKVLTGITTSGTPHLGNLVGAILPAIEASKGDDTSSFLFLADYHSLIKNFEFIELRFGFLLIENVISMRF